MSNTLKRRLSWRIRVMMAERNIKTAIELHRLLVNSGYQIASSQLTRIINNRPERINVELLDHLLEILDCDIGDLLRSVPVSEEDATTEPQKQRVRREPVKYNPDDDLTGPKVTPFPIPPRKK